MCVERELTVLLAKLDRGLVVTARPDVHRALIHRRGLQVQLQDRSEMLRLEVGDADRFRESLFERA